MFRQSFASGFALAFGLFAGSAVADIVTDGTVGPAQPLEGPYYHIPAELGTVRDRNLFHSFEKFSLQADQSADFTGPDHIANVISRVTGGERSYLDGYLASAMPNADFYFFNPAGVVFGPNAYLDLPAAMHFATADTIQFQDGSIFSADLAQASQFTTAAPAAFGFLATDPAPLEMQNPDIQLQDHKALSLTGGTVTSSQGGQISTFGGSITLEGVSGPGTTSRFADGALGDAPPGDVTLRDLVVNANNGGNITINADTLVVEGEYAHSSLSVSTNNAMDGGELLIRANHLRVTHGSSLRGVSNAQGTGKGGTIQLRIREDTVFDNTGNHSFFNADGTETTTFTNATVTNFDGDGGSLEIETGTLTLRNGAYLTANTFGAGAGGQIQIDAREILIQGTDATQGAGGSIQVTSRSSGQGGTLSLRADSITIQDGGNLNTNAISGGAGGTIQIEADRMVLEGADGSGFASRIVARSQGAGQGGDVVIKSGSLQLTEGSLVNSDSEGVARGGNITLEVDTLTLSGVDGYGFGSLVATNAMGQGDGGVITIRADNLTLLDGGQVSASSLGAGNGGTVDVTVRDKAYFAGADQSGEDYRSGLFSTAQGTYGDGGQVLLKTDVLRMDQGADISAMTYSEGKGGDVGIQARAVYLSGDSLISARSESYADAGQVYVNVADGHLILQDSVIETEALSADGGDIAIDSPGYLFLRNSRISSSVNEDFGGGGNLYLNPEFLVLNGGEIFAKAKKGVGGNINIVTTGLYKRDERPVSEIINASSEFGVDGVVTISTPDESTQESVFALPTGLLAIKATLRAPCAQSASQSRMVSAQPQGVSTTGQGDFLPAPIPMRVPEAIPVSRVPGAITVASLDECQR